MVIPPGHTEATVLEAIERAVGVLAPSFTFGYFDVDDIRQQGRVFAIEILEKETYDPSRKLENYLYTHIHNRLCNFKRDNFRRNDPPCPPCHRGEWCEEGGPCSKYSAWKKRNAAKSNLMRPLDIEHVHDEHEPGTRTPSTVEDDVQLQELLRMIDQDLPVELRQSYLQMRAGVSVPKARRLQVEKAVSEILKGEVGCPSEDD